MLAGLAAGIADRWGIDVTLVRLGLVVAGLLSGGVVAALYVGGWLVLPMPLPDGTTTRIWPAALQDRRGLALALSLIPVLAAVLLVAGELHAGRVDQVAWPAAGVAAGLILVLRNAPDGELDVARRTLGPLASVGSRRSRRTLALRVLGGAAMAGGGVLLTALGHGQLAPALVGIVLVLVALVVVFGPWWLRLGRDLVLERQARVRAEERAEVAARVHDSVLQTLALIQRNADQPQRVAQLARAQERELRSWLFEGRTVGGVCADTTTVAGGVRWIQEEVEAAHGVPVEVVVVGDCPLDDGLEALVAAAREATVNAAKWSGAPVVSLFAEVEPSQVSVFVRDRGRGFDPAAVAADRRGVAESIRGRMTRHGGEAAVRSAPGEGTEVALRMCRRPATDGGAPPPPGGAAGRVGGPGVPDRPAGWGGAAGGAAVRGGGPAGSRS